MQILYLYTTSGCHLCEQAESLLVPVLVHANRLRAQSGAVSLILCPVEITEDPALTERHGSRIPVLRVDGETRELGWPFDQEEAFAFLSLPQGHV